MAKILVVDDEEAISTMIKMTLEESGYQVETVTDGVEALERLEAGLPDLLILDIALKRLDGYTVATRLRDNPKMSALPVIVVTGRGQMQSFLHQHPNVRAFVEKPFNPHHLAQIVNGLLGKKP